MPGRPLNQRLAAIAVRALSMAGGIYILYHEVVVSQTAEALLVFVGLWLAGAPIADLLDKLRQLATSVKQQLPEPPSDPPSDPSSDSSSETE